MSDDTTHPREKASKIPSWIMVGFILGGLSAYTLLDVINNPNKDKPLPQIAPTISGTPQPTTPTTQPEETPLDPAAKAAAAQAAPLSQDGKNLSLFAVDAIFQQWAVNAMWEYDTSQVVLWNPAEGKYSVAVEVTRRGIENDYKYFYRLIDNVTRPLIHDTLRPEMPILFTESDEVTKRREEKEREQWRWR